MSTEWSDLERRLSGLSSDLGDASLPGPHAARSRARQRTRRQVAGATFGAVAVGAVGVVVLGGIGPLSVSPPEPADTPTPSPSPTGDVVEPDDRLALTVDDLEASSGVDEPVGWQLTDTPPAEPFHCAPTAGEADRVIERWFHPSDDAYLAQIIEVSSPDQARARFDAVVDEVVSCVEERNAENPDDNWLSTIWKVDGVGDSAWLGEYAVPPRGPNDELMIVQVYLVLAGDTVTIITQGGPGMHGHQVGPLPYEIAMAAADRLCTVAGQDCVGEPVPRQLYPEINTEVAAGWLTVDDVVTALPYFESISAAAPVEDADSMSYWFVCLDEANPGAAGATSVELGQYYDPNDESAEIRVTQYVSAFESAGAAESHFDQILDAVAGCGAEETGRIAGAAYQGVAWQLADDVLTSHFGAVVSGGAVSVVMAGEPSFAQDELPAAQIQALLDAAGARLAQLER